MLRLSCAAAALFLPAALLAQPSAPTDATSQADPFESIQWQKGPTTAQIGSESRLSVPEECEFTDRAGARQFMIATENPPSGNELGVLICDMSEADGDEWFVVFSFDDSGYVKDDDASELDADAILSSIRESNEVGNQEREKQGWARLDITGWAKPPHYDLQTNNLTWALNGMSEGSGVVNHSVRLLGRGGVMHADLVVSPERFEATVPEFDRIIGTHAFVEGRKYAEWKPGDKVAKYGLTALVAGGAVAVAAKSGILAKLLKPIIVGLVAVGAWIKSLFSRKPKQGDGAQ
ncbi:MAG TPA: DUF2167 domain-containing protein [Longimicrobium sp.]|nr:DUF2167 domain-containing protein [Longimicrobium sp.]